MTKLSFEDKCFIKAHKLVESGLANLSNEMTIFDLTELLMKMEIEKEYKDSLSDKTINYNDEIVSIEEIGDMECIDISVTGDNLFFCNGILTKNSFGTVATADLVLALINTEELEQLGQLMIKQLKNRYNDVTKNKKFLVGVDRSKMRLFDIGDIKVDNEEDDSESYGNNKSFGKSSFNNFKY